MANVLNEEKKQQVLALGRLGWSLRRIQQATGIRRETAGAYLKAAGIGGKEMARLCYSHRGRTAEGVGSGLRRAGTRKCEQDQNTAVKNAFGGEWECIHRWLPL